MELDKYVGIKHKFNGDAFNGADCIGLRRLFFILTHFFGFPAIPFHIV